jgi:hypothetical protein
MCGYDGYKESCLCITSKVKVTEKTHEYVVKQTLHSKAFPFVTDEIYAIPYREHNFVFKSGGHSESCPHQSDALLHVLV